MARVSLGDGRWFDESKATKWEEATRWNGSNRVSVATGSQWAHEVLYRTAGGAWVLHAWSQWQGTLPSYELVSEERAHRWLIRCGHFDDVPAESLAGLEV